MMLKTGEGRRKEGMEDKGWADGFKCVSNPLVSPGLFEKLHI